MNYDIAIIGAGVTGSAIARELSKYDLKICVIEAHSDVCEGTSKANSGIVHAGFDAHPGSLKAKLNAQGAKKMEDLSKELDFHFRRNGAMVVAFNEKEIPKLEKLAEQSIENQVGPLKIISGDEARKLEPALSEKVIAALLIEQSGIVCPFNMTIAFAENAAENGVEFRLNSKVLEAKRQNFGYNLAIEYNEPAYLKNRANKSRINKYDDALDNSLDNVLSDTFEPHQEITAKMVINAAGVYGDIIHNQIIEQISGNAKDDRGSKFEEIIPRRGEYCLYDHEYATFVQRTIFQVPTELGKGVLVTPTVHWNLMIGPNAVDLEDKGDKTTTAQGIEEILQKAEKSLREMPAKNKIITSFAGIRAHRPEDDFLIEEIKGAPGFIDVIGIESPGLSCAPAMGEYVSELVKKSAEEHELFKIKKKSKWNGRRKGFTTLWDAKPEERDVMVKKNPAYGQMICRCEKVTKGEIEDAINRPLGATTLDGLKRRVRSGSGRCQEGFCTPKLLEILAENLNCTVEDITKSGGNSFVLRETELLRETEQVSQDGIIAIEESGEKISGVAENE